MHDLRQQESAKNYVLKSTTSLKNILLYKTYVFYWSTRKKIRTSCILIFFCCYFFKSVEQIYLHLFK